MIYSSITIEMFLSQALKDKFRPASLTKKNLLNYKDWFVNTKHVGVRNNSKHKSYYHSWCGAFLNWYLYILSTPKSLGVPKAVKNKRSKVSNKNLVLAA